MIEALGVMDVKFASPDSKGTGGVVRAESPVLRVSPSSLTRSKLKRAPPAISRLGIGRHRRSPKRPKLKTSRFEFSLIVLPSSANGPRPRRSPISLKASAPGSVRLLKSL